MRAFELHEANTGFQLYVDMDGVLVDFVGGVKKFMKNPSYDMDSREHKKIFWAELNQMDPTDAEELWANLSWTRDGKILWKYVSKFNPIILSSPGTTSREIIEGGKAKWLTKNLNPSPAKIIFETEKWNYAGKYNILIDDSPKHTIAWEEHGGISIPYKEGNAKKTIKELQKRFRFPRK